MVRLRSLCTLLLALAVVYSITPIAAAVSRHTAMRAPPAAPAGPTPDMKIAAVVNDEVISEFDLTSRLKLVELSSNLPDTPENRQRIEPQVLRSLVDERLQLQEAKRQNIVATDDELNNAVSQIEKQNNMQSGQLNEFLKTRGIDRGSLINQLTASIVWAKLVRRLAAQNTEISDEDVDAAMKRLKEHAGEPQSRVAEIFLAVDNPGQDQEVRNLAVKLSDQMHHGARFSAVAQQFSQSATAAVGGDLGWLRLDQLPPELAAAAGPLKPGELSQPIRTNSGYYLILVLDRRNGATGGSSGSQQPQQQGTVYDVAQVVLPLPTQLTEATKKAALADAQALRQAKSCPELIKLGQAKAPRSTNEGKVNMSAIAPQMRDLIMKLKVGQASEPILQRNGIGILMVCSTDASSGPVAVKSGDPTREEVFDSLLRQKLDTVSRRYLRDLRRGAYVDVRV